MTQNASPPMLNLVPDSAPFSEDQRAWLNGFLAGFISLDGATNACTVHLTGEHYGAGGAAGMTFTGKASGTTILSGSCWSPNDWSTFSAVTAYSLNDNRKLDVTFGGTGSVRNLRCVVIEFPD